jgi:hypothetical protein
VHLVVTPAALIKFAIVGLKDTLTLSDSFAMLTFVLVASQVKGETKTVSRASIEHTLVAEAILKKHVTYAMHLALYIYLTIVDI